MARLLFDSDVVADLPRNSMGATYSDLVPDRAALELLRAQFLLGLVLIQRHPGVPGSAADPTGEASDLDVEKFTVSPDYAPLWWDRKTRAGVDFLTVYANRSTMPIVDVAMARRPFFRHFATLDGTMHIDTFPPGHAPALVQFAGEAALGFHADCSVVWEDQWHPSMG